MFWVFFPHFFLDHILPPPPLQEHKIVQIKYPFLFYLCLDTSDPLDQGWNWDTDPDKESTKP